MRRRAAKYVFLVLLLCGLVQSGILITPGKAIGQTFTGVERRITTNLADQFDPAISGNIIVYTDTRGDDPDIWYYDLSTGVEAPVTTAPGTQQLTDVSDGVIAYTDFGTMDVLVFNTATGTTTNLTKAAGSTSIDPAIGQGIAAWQDDRDGNPEIYAQNLSTGEVRRISNSPDVDQAAAVSHGTIVWQRCAAGTCDIYSYDWASDTTRQLTNTPGRDERFPGVSGNSVVYQVLTSADYDVCHFNLTTGVEKCLSLPGSQRNPAVSGDFVAFDDTSTGLYHVRLWHVPTGSVFDIPTSSYGSQYLNAIDGNRVVYTDDRNNQLDIYLYEFQATFPPSGFGREIFHADFDADTAGLPPNPASAGLPDGDSITLMNADTGGNSMLVQGPAGGLTGNSLRITKTAGIGNSPIFEGRPDPAFGPYTSGKYRIAWQSLSEAVQHYGFAALVGPDNHSAFTVNYSMDGVLKLQDGAGTMNTGVHYTPNRAQRFEAMLDLDARTFDLSIDGTTVAFGRQFQHAEFTALDRFFWEIGGIETESYAIDEISIRCVADVDTLPPVTTAAASPSANASGWQNAPVTVTLSANDGCAGLGVKEIHYLLSGAPEVVVPGSSASLGIAVEGETTVAYFAVDNAGNREQTKNITVRIDKTPPVILGWDCSQTVTLNSAFSLNISVFDSLSGVGSQSVPNGSYAFETSTVGDKKLSVSASDRAGNSISQDCSYRVIYDFAGAGGFGPPVQNPPATNTARAGSAVPVKWQLPDGKGGFISDVSVVTTILVQEIFCATHSPVGSPVPAATSGGSGLRYDPATNQFIFTWKTDRTMAGRCFRLTLKLNDGSEYYAYFSFS